jgi:hypothetical protein
MLTIALLVAKSQVRPMTTESNALVRKGGLNEAAGAADTA